MFGYILLSYNLIFWETWLCSKPSRSTKDKLIKKNLNFSKSLYIRCVLSKWDYFVKKENLILGLKIKTRTNKEEQKININYLYK